MIFTLDTIKLELTHSFYPISTISCHFHSKTTLNKMIESPNEVEKANLGQRNPKVAHKTKG